jgi:hypothetical protein
MASSDPGNSLPILLAAAIQETMDAAGAIAHQAAGDAVASIPGIMGPYVDKMDGLLAASLGTLASVTGPVKSAKFPFRNGMVAGVYGLIGQPKANLFPWFNADGAMFVTLDIPQERMNEPRTYGILGSSATGGRRVQLYYSGATTAVGSRRRFSFYGAGANGGAVTPVSEVIPATVQRALVVVQRVGNDVAINVWDIETGTKYAGAPVTNAALNIDSYTPTDLFIGGLADVAGPRGSIGNTVGWWPSTISDIGYTTSAPTDATWGAIARGADIVTLLGAATVKWLRKFNAATGSIAKPAGATADATAPAVVYGDVKAGGDIRPAAATNSVTINRLPENYVFGVAPASRAARAEIGGVATLDAAGVVQVRAITDEGRVLVDWYDAATLAASGPWTTTMVLPKIGSRSVVFEARVKGFPLAVFRLAGPYSVGYKIHLIGQSQIANMLTTVSNLGLKYTGPMPMSVIYRYSSSGIVAAQSFLIDSGGPINIPIDGTVALATALSSLVDAPCQIIWDAVGGTSALDWINDAQAGRLWTDTTEMLALAGADVSTVLWQWYTNMVSQGGDYGALTFDPAIRGIGTGAAEHYLYQAVRRQATLVVMPYSREDVGGGPFDFDQIPARDTLRASAEAWATANGAIVGCPAPDLTLKDAYHETDNAAGLIRLAQHIALSIARGLMLDASRNPKVMAGSARFTSAARAALTFSIDLPNFGILRNGMGNTIETGGDLTVKGVEVSPDGVTWTRSGFDAVIDGRNRIRLTKGGGGAWAAGLKLRAWAGGPYAYGFASTDGNAATAYHVYDSYERHPNRLGVPISTSNIVHTVAEA